MKSLCELMQQAYTLSLRLAYSEFSPDGTCFTVRDDDFTDDENDTIFGWVDGLISAYYFKMVEGRCSLAATINFDIEEFEEQVKKDIALFERLGTKVPAPVTLTVEEMVRRGYVV